MNYTASIFLLSMLSVPTYATQRGQIQLAQMTPQDSAHTLVTPNAPNPARASQTVQLPQGGTGVITGGTSGYQTLTTPGGGSALAVPNGGGTSTVTGTGGRSGTVTTPR
jgi:hypothetical protein